MRRAAATVAATALIFLTVADAFLVRTPASKQRYGSSSSGSMTQLHNVGGWGVGPARELTPEEFGRGERRAFEGYNLRDRGEFMRQVARDKDELLNSELDELLGVAASAGIQVKDPAERLGKFELDDEDEELDVSVQWDEDDDVKEESKSTDDSITRLDEDTGASGVW